MKMMLRIYSAQVVRMLKVNCISALALLAISLIPSHNLLAADSHVRPFWGHETLWGYWTFRADYIPKKDWKIVSAPAAGADAWKAANLIDDHSETFYGASGQDAYDIVIDLGREYELGAFTIVTLERPNNAVDSRMARYEFFVSKSKDDRGKAVAAGAFEAAEGEETVVRLPAVTGRYVTLKAYARATASKDICIRELSLVSADTVKQYEAMDATAGARRQASWDGRDSEAAVARFGQDFLDELVCTPEDINRSNLRNRPRLEEVGKLKAAGKYAGGFGHFEIIISTNCAARRRLEFMLMMCSRTGMAMLP